MAINCDGMHSRAGHRPNEVKSEFFQQQVTKDRKEKTNMDMTPLNLPRRHGCPLSAYH